MLPFKIQQHIIGRRKESDLELLADEKSLNNCQQKQMSKEEKEFFLILHDWNIDTSSVSPYYTLYIPPIISKLPVVVNGIVAEHLRILYTYNLDDAVLAQKWILEHND